MKANRKGFSVIEVLIVVVVIGLIGALGYVGWNAMTKKPTTADSSVTAAEQKVTPTKIESKSDLETATKTLDSTSLDDADATKAESQASL